MASRPGFGKRPPQKRGERQGGAKRGGAGRARSNPHAMRKRPAAAKKERRIRVTAAPGAPAESDGKVRLNRFLASAGVCSRRAADDIIAAGRVAVNGEQVRELGVRVDPERDVIELDGMRVRLENPVYVLFNKPKGVVCTNARHELRRRAIDFLDDVRGRIYTVGRLDMESEGLILLTNDGAFAQAVAHPRFGVPKTYAVLVKGRVEREAVQKARSGLWLSDGKTAGGEVRVERQSHDRSYLKVMLREGKNREIRRVFARLGHDVLELKRIRIGRLTLHGLRPGAHRFLRKDEVRDLLASAGPSAPAPRARGGGAGGRAAATDERY